MATVPLREETVSEWMRPVRPRLVLEDCTLNNAPASSKRLPVRRVLRHRWENLLFVVAAATVLLFFLVNFALSLYRSAASSYQSPLTPAVVLAVRVHSGDTLWTYAREYGSPDVYILDRVETIARANHLSSDSTLVPGQRLLIPITNPVKLAQLDHAHRLAQR